MSERFKPHSRKQQQFLLSQKRIAILASGIQFGKTRAGVVWLKMQMHRYTDETDNFLVTSPTYKILAQSTLPPFLEINKGLGKMNREDYFFQVYNGGKVWFRTGQIPDSPIGLTNVRAILCDEGGLYSRYFWDNIQARGSFRAAPIRIVTSPYSLNWLYQDFIKPHMRGDEYIRNLCDLVQATSKENPYFPEGEYEDRRRTMDARRFNMIYGGNFDKAEGLVYDIFSEDNHVIEPIKKLPAGTKYYAGVDWGYTDAFVISMRAVTPEGIHYKIGEYYKVKRSITQMCEAAHRFRNIFGTEMHYCDPSRPEYIEEFNRQGLRACAADNRIRIGIDRHYELIASGLYYVFRGTSPHTVDEYAQYHYPELKDLKPDQRSKDELPVDANNHCMDSERYLTLALFQNHGKKNRFTTHTENQKPIVQSIYRPDIESLKKRKKNYANIPL